MPARSGGSSGSARRGKSNVIKIDFSGVETRKRVEEGEYEVAVEEVEQKDGQNAPYLAWKFKIDEGSDSDGGVLYLNTSLSEQSLWNLKALLEALGIAIEDDEMELDIESYVGEKCMVAVELELYEGKKRPRIVDFWAVEAKGKPAATKGKPDKEKPAAAKGKAAGKGKPDPEPEKDKLTQDQISDMDESELEDIVKEYDFYVDLEKFKTLRKKQAAVIDAAEKAEMLEE